MLPFRLYGVSAKSIAAGISGVESGDRTMTTRGYRISGCRGRHPVRLRFCVEHPTSEDNQFFNVRCSAGELVVMLNADHAFYERFYSRLNARSFAATGPVLKHIEVMLLAAA